MYDSGFKVKSNEEITKAFKSEEDLELEMLRKKCKELIVSNQKLAIILLKHMYKKKN